MSFRIGLNMGDVIIEGDNLYGEGVNVAGDLRLSHKPMEYVYQKVWLTL